MTTPPSGSDSGAQSPWDQPTAYGQPGAQSHPGAQSYPGYGQQPPAPGAYGQQPPASPYGQQPPAYGQPAYGQPAYGQQPAWGQQQPAAYPGAYPQNPFGDPYVQPVSRGTAIAASVLAFLGALHMLVSLVIAIWVFASDDYYQTGATVVLLSISIIIYLAVLALLLTGGILFLRQKKIGRLLVVIGAGLVVAFQILDVIVTVAAGIGAGGAYGAGYAAGAGIVGLLILIFPIVTIVLALIPPTTRWLNAAPR
ncbi:hypothetical protein ACWDPV_05325 [Gordonia sp. NPDC003504]